MTLLRDPIWQFAGAALALLAVVVSLWVSWKQRRSKRIVCVPRHVKLLSVASAIQSEVQVLFRGQDVRDVGLVELRVLNFGNVPIEPRDYVDHVKISFGANASVLTAEVIRVKPDDLRATLNASVARTNGEVHIAPALLNPRDEFTLKCLVTGFSAVNAHARIAGLRAVEIRREEYLTRHIDWWIWGGALPVSLVALGWTATKYLGIRDWALNALLMYVMLLVARYAATELLAWSRQAND